MTPRERVRALEVVDLIVTGSLKAPAPQAAASPADSATTIPTGPKVVGGQALVTGSGSIATGLTTIAGITVTLGQAPTLAADTVSAVPSGPSIIVTVTGRTSTADPTPAPSAVPTVVNWIAFGS